MSTEPNADAAGEPEVPPAENAYLGIGLAAVVVLGVALLQSHSGRWSVIPTLIGAAGLAFRWRSAPLVLLAAVAFTQIIPFWVLMHRDKSASPVVIDLGLCGAVLAYVLAQYRLFGLTTPLFPPDPRRRLDKPPPRDAVRVPAREVPTALVTVATAAVGAAFLWRVVSSVPPEWGAPPQVWKMGLVAWIVGAAILLATSVIGYLGWRRLSADEASLYLRDVLWQETRGEQRRIQRWRAWAMLRRERES
jgi:hypothetical protein